MFWIFAVLLTVLVSLPVVWPLLQRRAVSSADGQDLDVYAAQLSEIDADLKRGLVSPDEAQIARAEIGRRLLRAAASDTRGRAGSVQEGRLVLMIGVVSSVVLPASALALYANTGAPGRTDMPLAMRQGAAPNISPSQGGDLQTMVAAAEARLSENPQDGRGWDVLAPIYARLGDVPRAQTAYRNALTLLGDDAQRLTGYGEVLVRAGGGEVTDEARQVFRRASELDPGLVAPRVFLALDMTQHGRSEAAVSAWTALLAEAPADAPWRPMAQAALDEARAGATRGSGPTQAEIVERAAATPEAAQARMIQGMVENLAGRLAAQPNDAAGWEQLVRAYGVLGDAAAGQAALESARGAFPPGTPEWARISNAAAVAGLVVGSGARP